MAVPIENTMPDVKIVVKWHEFFNMEISYKSMPMKSICTLGCVMLWSSAIENAIFLKNNSTEYTSDNDMAKPNTAQRTHAHNLCDILCIAVITELCPITLFWIHGNLQAVSGQWGHLLICHHAINNELYGWTCFVNQKPKRDSMHLSSNWENIKNEFV